MAKQTKRTKLTIPEIAEYVDMPLRTVYRDIKRMQLGAETPANRVAGIAATYSVDDFLLLFGHGRKQRTEYQGKIDTIIRKRRLQRRKEDA